MFQKRKAQNRAAQRAFRERKEKHLTDLEAKVDDLQKASDDANQENGLLKAQVERLQVELREYRKRLSWVTQGNALSAINSYPGNASRMTGLHNNDFSFDFPKFGDLPGGRIFNGGSTARTENKAKDGSQVPGILRHSQPANDNSSTAAVPKEPSHKDANAPPIKTNGHPNQISQRPPGQAHDTSTSDSPCSSSDSRQFLSSCGTSPEPAQSPENKPKDPHDGHACTIDGEKSFCAQLGLACGNIKNPVPAVRHPGESASNTPNEPENTEDVPGIDFMAQQNGGQFDPLLFGDWREPQDAVLTQDFNSFFDDAFPLPDLGSPSHNITEADTHTQPKKNILEQMDNKMDEEVVPGEDKAQMLSCNKIWYVTVFQWFPEILSDIDLRCRDRLQSMEKFRNGEIDVDNLCSELRTKARCSEGGVVVNQNDVDNIIGRS